MEAGQKIKFREGDKVLDLIVEKTFEGWAIGWCPQLRNNLAVHPSNIVAEEPPSSAAGGSLRAPDPQQFFYGPVRL